MIRYKSNFPLLSVILCTIIDAKNYFNFLDAKRTCKFDPILCKILVLISNVNLPFVLLFKATVLFIIGDT